MGFHSERWKAVGELELRDKVAFGKGHSGSWKKVVGWVCVMSALFLITQLVEELLCFLLQGKKGQIAFHSTGTSLSFLKGQCGVDIS